MKGKKKEIEVLRSEEAPSGLFAKCKFYFKRYWYIAVPVHFVCSLVWFSATYVLVKSGVDVIALLHMLHIPEALIEKVKNTPPSAGVVVIALILYKVRFVYINFLHFKIFRLLPLFVTLLPWLVSK